MTDLKRGNITRARIDWDQHIQDLFEEGNGAFEIFYRMSHISFMKLVNMLYPIHNPKYKRCNNIRSELKLHCLIRCLAGGMYLYIRFHINVATSKFYSYAYATMRAIMMCDDLSYSFPTDIDEIETSSSKFSQCCHKEAVNGCVACVDGYFLEIDTPTKR